MGRQCQIKTMVPSLELVPPAPDAASESQQIQDLADKPSIEESSNEEGSSVQQEEQQTAEPLGPIVITDPPPSSTVIVAASTTVNPAATAGKWPTEVATPVTESSERDNENEA